MYCTTHIKESESDFDCRDVYVIYACWRPTNHTYLSVILVLNMILTSNVSHVLLLLLFPSIVDPSAKLEFKSYMGSAAPTLQGIEK